MKQGRMSRRINFIILVLLGAFLIGGNAQADESANWGYLQFVIKFDDGTTLPNNSTTVVKDTLYYPGATDGIDPPQGQLGYDIEQTLFSPNRSGGLTLIEGNKLNQEVSPNSTRIGKHIKGFYKGTIAPGNEPNMVAELTWFYAEPTEGRFGDMSLILTKEDSDANNIEVDGYRGNVRAEMANSGVTDFTSITLGKVPAGTYSENGPYFLHLRLDFEKLIADLDQDNEVNFKDFSIVSKYWGYEGACLADITGPNGIPDGNVDMYDLLEFVSEWLD